MEVNFVLKGNLMTFHICTSVQCTVYSVQYSVLEDCEVIFLSEVEKNGIID